jgi:hypothetical protein
MKIKLYFALILMMAVMSAGVKAENELPHNQDPAKDSIIVTFGKKTRLIIYGDNREELDKIMKYDLNALLKDLKIRLDSADADTTYLREEINGNDYLKNKSDEKDAYVRIGLRGVHIKDGDTEVRINAGGVEVKDKEGAQDSASRKTSKRFYKHSRGSSPRKGFNFELGLNTYGTNEMTPGFSKDDYDLKPFGSRYVSLGYVASTRIAKGKNAGLHLDLGASFSWYNLMFDGNNTVVKSPDRVSFPTVSDADGREVQFQKSKLVVPNVNLSLMPTVSFNRSFISHISAGVYGGYRLGSYTKTREEGSKNKDHVRTNFHITDLRYGIGAEVGIRRFVDFFVNYDRNTLFEEGHGPKIKMLSFGIRM